MNLAINGHHLDVTPAIREHLEQKLAKIKRHFDNVIDITVFLSVEKLRHRAEINLNLPGKELSAEAIEGDLYAAIDLVIDKLDRQVLKHKECIRAHNAEAPKRQLEVE
jgi:putative sigma-54 modulation protein